MYVLHDLLPERFRIFETALITDAPQELHANSARRHAIEGVEQECLDTQLSTRAERGAVTNVADGIPLSPTFEIACMGDVDAASGKDLGRCGQIQRWNRLLRTDTVSAADFAFHPVCVLQVSRRE